MKEDSLWAKLHDAIVIVLVWVVLFIVVVIIPTTFFCFLIWGVYSLLTGG